MRPLRVAVVGPTHPYKGGVAAHTTTTAHRLSRAGHDVVLVTWSRLYPKALYPGEQAVPDGAPDVEPFPATVRPLRWDRPGSWWRAGRRLRDVDVVVLVAVVPAQVPGLLTVVRSARRGPGPHPRIVVLAHNVVPHETHPGGEWLMTRLLSAADAVLVHSAQMAQQAREHGARDVVVVPLPPHLPGGHPASRPGGTRRDQAVGDLPAADGPAAGRPVRVLALGIVRSYKGVDVLLEAAAAVPGVQVTVAGEQWGTAGERVREVAADSRLAGRVEVERGYVPAARIPDLLTGHDVLSLTYRHATASQNVLLAHAYGLPVLASRVGTFPEQVRDGVDGLLVPPDDVPAVAAALERLTRPGELDRLRAGVPEVDLDGPWEAYVSALVTAGDPVARAADAHRQSPAEPSRG